MAKPYASEIAKLSDTFAWAANTEIKQLRQAIRVAGQYPLRAIGSGGSLSAAHALASFHQRFAGKIAAVATPLETACEPVDSFTTNWLLSAGGGNVDILSAAKKLIQQEPRQLTILCGKEQSPLAELGREHPFIDLLVFPPPAGKDGFLATNSLLGFVSILARSYATEFDRGDDWASAVNIISALLSPVSQITNAWQVASDPIWERPTTLVLYSPSTRIGAIDLESKFTEAALGNLQLADYRNFAHGRHHWLAKRGQASAVLALVTKADEILADRTLALIPTEIPKAKLFIPGEGSAAALGSLVAALRLTGWVGKARGIDPGQPGVPDFGRKLYHLPLPKPEIHPAVKGLSERDAAAIMRKSGASIHQLIKTDRLQNWRDALETFRSRLKATTFGAIVLDYDGTVVDTRSRFQPPSTEMARHLTRILEGGGHLAIATGRGVSVRRDLRSCLPEAFWPNVLIGYYNGGEIAALSESQMPNGGDITCDSLAPLAKALRDHLELREIAVQTDRQYQITLEAKQMVPENRLWDLAYQVILKNGFQDINVTRSSHSIDIVPLEVTKLSVVRKISAIINNTSILCIGDRGRWPGNDHELLRTPLSLGVDEISTDIESCWNLALPGQRGVNVTLEYLSLLEVRNGMVNFRSECLL